MKFREFAFILSLIFSCPVYAGDLTFQDAINRTLSLSPRLSVTDSIAEGKIGERIQAGLAPNPVASYSVENIFGTNNWTGWQSAESRYEMAQLIELGGKRGYRVSVAQYQAYASEAGYEASQLDILNRLMKLFVQVVASQEALRVSEDQKAIALEVYNTVAAKVEAGKVSLFQQIKADIALSNTEITLRNARVNLFSAKERLALLWGDSCPDFDNAVFPFFDVVAPCEWSLCMNDLRNNPELIQAQYNYMAAQESWNLERSNGVPDLTVSVGYKTVQDTHDKGMILGASIPIPVFNRNQGNVYRATTEITRTEALLQETQLALENKLQIAYKDWIRAYQEVKTLQDTVLRSANQAFELVRYGYQEGKFEYLEMLDAQRTLFEARERYIQALLTYHQRRADIEYLISRVD